MDVLTCDPALAALAALIALAALAGHVADPRDYLN